MQVNFKNRSLFIENPNICPHCHVANTPTELWNKVTKDTDDVDCILSSWFCVNGKCHRTYITQHKLKNEKLVMRYLNGFPKGPAWPKPIKELKSGKKDAEGNEISSNFIKTYTQSLKAENSGLDELAGVGYRKAIEYLVKDWAIQNKPKEKNKIEKSWLGEVIKEYYDGDLKEILERATWLGNDHAHYIKLFEEFDIDVLKELIDLIMVELDRQYKNAHFIGTIKSKNIKSTPKKST